MSDTLKEALKCFRRVAYVCLEVGTAQRYTVGHTIQLNDNAVIIDPVRFVQVALVGGAHL
jgi:hypothetical protein